MPCLLVKRRRLTDLLTCLFLLWLSLVPSLMSLQAEQHSKDNDSQVIAAQVEGEGEEQKNHPIAAKVKEHQQQSKQHTSNIPSNPTDQGPEKQEMEQEIEENGNQIVEDQQDDKPLSHSKSNPHSHPQSHSQSRSASSKSNALLKKTKKITSTKDAMNIAKDIAFKKSHHQQYSSSYPGHKRKRRNRKDREALSMREAFTLQPRAMHALAGSPGAIEAGDAWYPRQEELFFLHEVHGGMTSCHLFEYRPSGDATAQQAIGNAAVATDKQGTQQAMATAKTRKYLVKASFNPQMEYLAWREAIGSRLFCAILGRAACVPVSVIENWQFRLPDGQAGSSPFGRLLAHGHDFGKAVAAAAVMSRVKAAKELVRSSYGERPRWQSRQLNERWQNRDNDGDVQVASARWQNRDNDSDVQVASVRWQNRDNDGDDQVLSVDPIVRWQNRADEDVYDDDDQIEQQRQLDLQEEMQGITVPEELVDQDEQDEQEKLEELELEEREEEEFNMDDFTIAPLPPVRRQHKAKGSSAKMMQSKMNAKASKPASIPHGWHFDAYGNVMDAQNNYIYSRDCPKVGTVTIQAWLDGARPMAGNNKAFMPLVQEGRLTPTEKADIMAAYVASGYLGEGDGHARNLVRLSSNGQVIRIDYGFTLHRWIVGKNDSADSRIIRAEQFQNSIGK